MIMTPMSTPMSERDRAAAYGVFQFCVANSVHHKRRQGHDGLIFKTFVSFVSIVVATQS